MTGYLEQLPSLLYILLLVIAFRGDQKYFNFILISAVCEAFNLFDRFYFAGQIDQKLYLTYTWLLPVYIIGISDLFIKTKYFTWLSLAPAIIFLSSVSAYYNLTTTQTPPLAIYHMPVTLVIVYTAILAVTALMLYYRSGNKSLDVVFLYALIGLSVTQFIKFNDLSFATPMWKISLNAYCGILFNVVLAYIVLKHNKRK